MTELIYYSGVGATLLCGAFMLCLGYIQDVSKKSMITMIIIVGTLSMLSFAGLTFMLGVLAGVFMKSENDRKEKKSKK